MSFHSKITQKLLSYFFVNTAAKKYLNELARILKVDAKNLDTKIKELERLGLFMSEFEGKQKYYFLNKDYPLLKEYISIFNKTFGVVHFLTTVFGKINNIKEAYIFGSYAKNEMDVNSDIDLLIIGSHKSLDAQKAILPLQSQVGREINIIDMTQNEFENRKAENDPLINDIFSKPIIKIL